MTQSQDHEQINPTAESRDGPIASAVDRTLVRILIMAGGASSRFFPVNKVFADPTGSGRTMIQQAKDRVTASLDSGRCKEFVSSEQFYVVTGAGARESIVEQLELSESNVLVEPSRRNTWPAVLWTLAHLRRESVDNIVVILTADHVIGMVDVFRENLADAIQVAATRDALVTIGIEPTSEPVEWTSFGAIKSNPSERVANSGASRIERFEEKPSEERANQMILEEGWVWNAGMFVFRITSAERALEIHQPQMFETYKSMAKAVAAGDASTAAAAFDSLPGKIPHPVESGVMADNSIDFSIMMPLTMSGHREIDGFSVPAKFPWTDIGSWDALRQVLPADHESNICVGDVELRNARQSIFFAEKGKRIVAQAVEGIIVVHGADGTVLVTRESEASQIKSLVSKFADRPQATVVFHDSRHCLVSSEDGRVGVHGLENVEITRQGDVVFVRAIEEPIEISVANEVLDRLCDRPLALTPRINHYAWGGQVLPGFLGTKPQASPTSEAWLTSTHPDGKVALESSPLSLAELIEHRPQVLGKWSRKLFGDESPIFVKFLSTRFPDKVHVGFHPGALTDNTAEFTATFTAALGREQALLGELLRALDPDVLHDEEAFEGFRASYEDWAVAQSESAWNDGSSTAEFLSQLKKYLRPETDALAPAELIGKLRENRAWLISHFNEIDLRKQSGNLLLLRAGVAHAIFGLSHQGHPRDQALHSLGELYRDLRVAAENGADEKELENTVDRAIPTLERLRAENSGAPKNEAWLPFEVDGAVLLVEPQQSSNTTYSWLDAYTPLVFRNGCIGFRKGDPQSGVSKDELERFVSEIDMVECDPPSICREPVEVGAGPGASSARLSRLVDDAEAWPYFTVYRVDLDGVGEAPAQWQGDHPSGAFQQVIVLQGVVELAAVTGPKIRLSPGVPGFVPATMSGGYTMTATNPASVLLISVPVPAGKFRG